MLSRANVVVVSDRRVIEDGQPKDDDENKVITFEWDDARLSVSFCGFARHGSFLTRRWLADALANAAGPDYLAASMIERLRETATLHFKSLRIDKRDKRVTIVLAGFVYDQTGTPS
jgi:hypothetical protein